MDNPQTNQRKNTTQKTQTLKTRTSSKNRGRTQVLEPHQKTGDEPRCSNLIKKQGSNQGDLTSSKNRGRTKVLAKGK